jgi:hypothetical protein
MKKITNYLLMSAALFILLGSCKKNQTSSDIEGLPNEKDGFVTLKSGVVVEKRGTDYIWEGDIILSKQQFDNLDKFGELLSSKPDYIGPEKATHPAYNIPYQNTANGRTIARAFSIYPTAYNLWAMVRIKYGSNMTLAQKQKVHSALLEIQSNTNIRFYNATCEPLTDPVYGFAYPNIEFWSTGAVDVSESKLGRQGGVQRINLADFSFDPWSGNSVIIHEICHALGMRHEQTRIDRDTYVNINTSNLTQKGLANFAKPSTDYYQSGAYDFNSVMGYSSYTSSASIVNNTSLPMYTKKDGSSVYQGISLSALDRAWLNNFYLPYVARTDTYSELAPTVYKPDGTVMTSSERLSLQAQLNNGNPNPPNCCTLTNDLGKFTCP